MNLKKFSKKKEDKQVSTVLEVKDLCFAYEQTNILENLSLDLQEGEFVAIIGQNGAGKSTLFKLILGELKAKSGEIKLFGEAFSKKRHYARLAYISQNSIANYRNFPTTIEELVRIHLSFLGKKNDVREKLEILGLTGQARQKLSELSGGQLQRVAVLLALLKEADLILLDEPTTGIDKEYSEELYKVLKKLKVLGKSIIMITHQLSELLAYVDKVYCIECGTCVEKTHGLADIIGNTGGKNADSI